MARAFSTTDDSDREDLVQVILEEHQVLKDCIDVLTDDEASKSEKKRALKRFVFNLRSHIEAEEQAVYPTLESMKTMRKQAIQAYTEHTMAKTLMEELDNLDVDRSIDDEIEAKAKVLAEHVLHHLMEEERLVIPQMRRQFDQEELEAMADDYLRISEAEREEADGRILAAIKRMSHALSESY
jgi:hemerythrin-like domain-containing protein